MRTTKQSKTRSTLPGLLLAVVGILSLQPLRAQGVHGSMYGTVLDSSGAVVANATVTIKSQQKETSFKPQTNSYRGNNWDSDDLSSIAVDNDFVHIVWVDGRAGFLGAWYARVPLTGY